MLEWLGSIHQVKAHNGKNMEQGEHSSTAGGTANSYSHLGNQWILSVDSARLLRNMGNDLLQD